MATAASEKSVQELYIAYFGRPADPAGLAFYADALDAGTDTLANIADSFALSTEAAAIVALDTDAFLTSFYLNAFGRAYDNSADVDGTFWADAINNNEVTKEQAMVEILGGASAVDEAASENKTEVAITYTTAVTADGAEYTAAEIADAQAILSAVTSDEATVATGNTAAAAEVASNVPGAEFALTAALADVTGAQDALDAFLLAAAQDPDVAGEEAALTEGQVTTAAATATGTVDVFVDGDYTNSAAGVKLAMISAQEAVNSAALTVAEATLAAAQTAVDVVAGLNDAVAASTAAATAATAAATAETAADLATAGELAKADALLEDNAAYAAAEVTGVVTLTTTGAVSLPNAAHVLTQVDADGVVSLTDAEDDGGFDPVTEAAETAEFNAAQALLADWVTAYNTGVAAAAATVAADAVALTAANAANALDLDSAAAIDLAEVGAQIVVDGGAAAIASAPTLTEMATHTTLLATEQTAAVAALKTAIEAVVFDTDDATTLLALEVVVDAAETAGVISTADNGAIITAFGDDATDDDDFVGGGLTTALAAASTAVDTNTTDAASAVFAGLVGDFTTTAATNPLATALAAAEDGVYDDNGTPTDFTDDAGAAFVIGRLATLVAAEVDANADAAEMAVLNEALDDANDAITDEGFAAPVTLTGNLAATSSDDVFLAGTADSDISGFSDADALFIGSDLTLNTNAVAGAEGVNSVLEVWLTTSGADTVVTIEDTAFGSDAATPEVTTITLTGIALEDVTLVDGLITVA